MGHNETKKTIWSKLFSGSGWALFTMFIWELVEEALEGLIAYALSSAVAIFVTKVLSTLTIITATQAIKVAIKRFCTPLIAKLTYKKGDDKLEKFKKFFVWIFANKKSLCGTLVGAVGAGLGITASWTIDSLPTIFINGYNIAPIIYTIVCCLAFVLNQLGVCGKGFEFIKQFFDRREIEKAEKEQKAIKKEAKKELKNELKLANQTLAQQAKAKAKAEAEAQAKAEKEKADAEHKAMVEKAKQEILAENNTNKA